MLRIRLAAGAECATVVGGHTALLRVAFRNGSAQVRGLCQNRTSTYRCAFRCAGFEGKLTAVLSLGAWCVVIKRPVSNALHSAQRAARNVRIRTCAGRAPVRAERAAVFRMVLVSRRPAVRIRPRAPRMSTLHCAIMPCRHRTTLITDRAPMSEMLYADTNTNCRRGSVPCAIDACICV